MNESMKRIPATLITGFLGSGKTTLLNRILNESHGNRIAVIENEFGEVSIDDALLTESAPTVFKMSNGCLCCTINGDLVNTLVELSQRRDEFDYIVIETTGVANPAPVIQTFLMNEDISDNFRLDAVVTLVDAKHLTLHAESKECIQQIALADIIILNKTDLVDEEELAHVSKIVEVKNKLARVHKTQRSALELKDILDQNAFSETTALEEIKPEKHEHVHEHAHGHSCEHEHGQDCEHDHEHDHDCKHEHEHDHDNEHKHDHSNHDHALHHHHHDENLSSVGLAIQGSLEPARFNAWFSNLIQQQGDKIFRIKGILSIDGKEKRVIVQTVHRVSEVTEGTAWESAERENKIVFIGESLDRSSLLTGMESCLA